MLPDSRVELAHLERLSWAARNRPLLIAVAHFINAAASTAVARGV
jgi:hypothetical protein